MFDQVNWNGRLVGIVGARGVGKTTMILQHIKETMDVSRCLYVDAEDFYFASHKLVDLADEFCKMGGEYLCVDEEPESPEGCSGCAGCSGLVGVVGVLGVSSEGA